MDLGTLLIIIAIVLVVVDWAIGRSARAFVGLLHLAVILGFVGVLLQTKSFN